MLVKLAIHEVLAWALFHDIHITCLPLRAPVICLMLGELYTIGSLPISCLIAATWEKIVTEGTLLAA